MSVTKSPNAVVYRVQNNGEWATIVLEQWSQKPESDIRPYRYMGELLIYSSFGRFGYQWTACGQPFMEFLLGLDRDYFMGKMYAGNTTVFDFDDSIASMKEKVRSVRKEQGITHEEARALYEAVESVDYADSDTDFVESCVMADVRGYAGHKCNFDEPWEFVRRKINPQCEGFWREIWPEFCNQLRIDVVPVG